MLKVGLEIHTQLSTAAKLFSKSSNPTSNLSIKPNSTASFFDIALPGTQPKISPQCIHAALKLAASLNCQINDHSTFDRKHYFYGDQPLGYQITQHYNPIAKNGSIQLLSKHHQRLNRNVTVNILQLQLEQDTGRSLYHSTNTSKSYIDYNRSNIPLIEMVTMPDFNHVEEVRIFLQTYVKLVQDLKICTGDLESGAIRVDVNVNVGDHPRVEIKNLPTISSIINAIRFEEIRQSKEKSDKIETRGWDGKKTFHLRSKESSVDYRYVPDMELPAINLQIDQLLPKLLETLPPKPHEDLNHLMSQYTLSARDAKMLHNNPSLRMYFQTCYDLLSSTAIKNKLINWLNHELVGALTKSGIPFSSNILNPNSFIQLILNVENGQITKPNGKLLLLHLVNNPQDQCKPIIELAKEFNMIAQSTSPSIDTVINQVIEEHPSIVKEIQERGKVQKINFLLGQCMRLTGGNVQPNIIREKLQSTLKLSK